MFIFSETVNEYLGKELVTEENELKFLYDFKECSSSQIDPENDSCYAKIIVWGEKLPISYELEKDEDGCWVIFDERIA